MTSDPVDTSRTPRPPGNLEREESQLWRWALGFMVLLAVALGALLWERLENIPFSLRAIPIGVLALSILFAVYAYGRRREVSDLKKLLHGLAGARRRGPFGRAARPAQPGHPALATQLQGVEDPPGPRPTTKRLHARSQVGSATPFPHLTWRLLPLREFSPKTATTSVDTRPHPW